VSMLEELVRSARERARALPNTEPAGKPTGLRFDDALRGKRRLSVIAEYKQASPSLGDIAERDVVEQVERYVRAGASAVSILTEPSRFRGSLDDLERAVRAVDVPVLMKDFVVHPAQVQAAARLGARAVLLIVRCLEPSELRELGSACRHYGLVPLVECHDEAELERGLAIEEAVLGINNRNLDTLAIDRNLAPRLIGRAPNDRVVVAESGYEEPEHTDAIRGVSDGVLIGSALMKRDDPAAFLHEVTR
jgi:indole-3-glycerol phosphate synthase